MAGPILYVCIVTITQLGESVKVMGKVIVVTIEVLLDRIFYKIINRIDTT